jgi:hypothetical protein
LLEPLLSIFASTLSIFASTSGGGIVALAFELDDLGLLRFMLFSERCSLRDSTDTSAIAAAISGVFAPMWRNAATSNGETYAGPRPIAFGYHK